MSKATYWIKSLASSLFWFVHQGRWGVKGVFDDVYQGQQQSPTFRSFFREVFGDDYDEEVDHTGFLTKTDLRNLAIHLGLRKDDALVDLACGMGGAGLWVARAAGARLIGIDISSAAIQKARQRVAAFGLAGRAEFRVGDIAATGLEAASVDGAMSVDSLYLVPDQTGAIRETARLLRSGACFVFTTWEVDQTAMIHDYRPLLERAGFVVQSREETPNWRERQQAIYERILAQRDTLIREMGEPSARFWIRGAETELPRLSRMRRVLIAARKK